MQSQNQSDAVVLEGEILTETPTSDYYEVRRRRMMAFLVDYLIIALLCVPAALIIGLLGVITLGAGWLLYAILVPVVAMAYLAITMGGENQATIGMKMFSIRIQMINGSRIDAPLAVLHGVLFWFIHSVLSPLMLFASMFSGRKRLLQDWLLGTEIVRN